jgi:hypothetical protein
MLTGTIKRKKRMAHHASKNFSLLFAVLIFIFSSKSLAMLLRGVGLARLEVCMVINSPTGSDRWL